MEQQVERPASADDNRAKRKHQEELLRTTGQMMDLHGICQSTMVQLTGGAFLTGYLLALGSGELMIGIAASIPLFSKLSQLFASWGIERSGHWWRTSVLGAFVGRVPLFLAALLPFMALPEPFGLWALTTIVAITALGGAVWEIAFLTWMAELIPLRIRGEFWGKRTRVSEFAGILVAVAAAIFFDWWRGAHPNDLRGFSIVWGVAAVAAVIGIYFLYRIPVPDQTPHRSAPASLIKTLARPARDANFRRLLAFVGSWGFAVGLIGPFTAVYMLKELNLSFVYVTVFTILPSMLIALTQAYWGRLTDHFGSLPVLRTASYIIVAATSLWLFSGPERIWPLFILQIVSGFGWSAYHVSMNNIVLKLAPPPSRSSYVASLGAIFAVTQAVAPILGGLLLTSLQGMGGATLESYYVLFGLSFFLRGVATPLLGGVNEPGGVPMGHMIRVMGRFRSMGAAPGTDLIFDYTYTHLARIADFITREGRKGTKRLRRKSGKN